MLAVGSLVEISGLSGPIGPPKELKDVPQGQQAPVDLNGQKGQLMDHDPKHGLWYVSTYNGMIAALKEENLQLITELSVPGEGGDANSYDIVIGPLSKREVLGAEIVSCLARKNFCVLRVMQSEKDMEEMAQMAKDMDADDKFTRLPKEFEEHMLGKGGKAKICNLEQLDGQDNGTSLERNDRTISYISEVLQLDAACTLGVEIQSRSATMMRMPFESRAEENRYPHPVLEDPQMEGFVAMAQRSKLGIMYFNGPSGGKFTLIPRAKGTKVELSAKPNNLVLWRTDLLNYKYEPDGPSLSLQSSYLANAPYFGLGELEGDTEALGHLGTGPPPPAGEQVSVVAIATRYPGSVQNSQQYWCHQAAAGTDGVVEMPFSRFDFEEYYDKDGNAVDGKMYTKHGGFIDNVENFDNRFFDLTPAESKCMDPMQRQIMETGWEALAGAGFDKRQIQSKSLSCGVFVGLDKCDWQSCCPMELMSPAFGASGLAIAIHANRVSFCLNLKGPSMVTDTACSASLVATHAAKLHLKYKENDPLEACLVVGTNMCLSHSVFVSCCGAGMLSHNGRCFTFDSSADGYLRGEGCGAHVIKLRSDQERLGVLAGSQVNQDGRSASLTAPNGPSQERCLLGAFREAELKPNDIDCMECHGTGTALGDPIEVGAQRKVMSRSVRDIPLYISTAKSNLGHLEGGAGVAGFIKCMNSIIRSQVPGNCHLRSLNPHLDTVGFPATFLSELKTMAAGSGYMGVSSFGFGGTNGHCMAYGKCIASSYGSTTTADLHKAFLKKVTAKPKVFEVIGDDPMQWSKEGTCPAPDSKPGDKYWIDLEEDEVTWTLQDQDIPSSHESFQLTGTFNNWNMVELDPEHGVPGLYIGNITLGATGKEEFNLVKDFDEEKGYQPSGRMVTKRSAEITGPKAHSKENTWLLQGKPGDTFTIDFFRSPTGSATTVSWRKLK